MRQTFPDEAIWANDAPEIDDPDATIYRTAYESGAGKTPPKAGVHNYLFRRSDEQHQHIERNGVPRWDPRTIYALGGWCLASDHNLYRSRVAGNVNHDPTATNGSTFWRSIMSIMKEYEHEVGSVVFRPTNPGLPESQGGFGFGTWQKISGRSPIGEGSFTDVRGETRNFVRGSSHGSFKHKLSIQEIPEHHHDSPVGELGNIESYRYPFGHTGTKRQMYGGHPAYDGYYFIPLTNKSGGNEPHNITHPVFAVPMWYRTA